MPAPPPGVDPEVLDDIATVEDAQKVFDSLGKPVEFWEALCLVKMERALLREEVRRLTDLIEAGHAAGVARVVIDRLRGLREAIGPLVASLREFLARVPDAPRDRDVTEMILGFIAISPKGRESASRWVVDASRNAAPASAKIRGLADIAEKYLAELRRRRPVHMETAEFQPEDPPLTDGASPPASDAGFEKLALDKSGVPAKVSDPFAAREPSPPPAPVAGAPIAVPVTRRETRSLPPGVDPDVLADVRLVEQCRKIFEVTHQQIEVWEVFCLVMLDSDTKEKMNAITLHRNSGETDAFMDGALALFEKLLDMRSKYGRFVRKLRDYIPTLQVGHFGKDTMEMALGFIVVSAKGRQRAQQWLDEPERHKVEASGRLEDIISRTINYQTALRMAP